MGPLISSKCCHAVHCFRKRSADRQTAASPQVLAYWTTMQRPAACGHYTSLQPQHQHIVHLQFAPGHPCEVSRVLHAAPLADSRGQTSSINTAAMRVASTLQQQRHHASPVASTSRPSQQLSRRPAMPVAAQQRAAALLARPSNVSCCSLGCMQPLLDNCQPDCC